ncbi:MAG: YqgE/AlgH family protein [Methylotetracoccus sp.]|nr:YqgE/AlgH family protein [Methylotetracoccus sp.]
MKPARFAFVMLILMIVLAAGASAYVTPRVPAAGGSPFVGQLLVASRRLNEPTFAQSVIYLVAHNDTGAMGLMVNRVLGQTTLKKLGSAFGLPSRSRKPIDVYLGGPVELGRGFVLHSGDYRGTNTLQLQRGLSLSTGLDVFRAITKGRGPKRHLLLLGYAGWGPGQLDHELHRGDWLLAPADESLIFSKNAKTVWEQALRNAGLPL